MKRSLLPLVLALILCALPGALHAAPFQKKPLPNVVGLPAIEAKAKIEAAGFTVKALDVDFQPLAGPPGAAAVVQAMQPAPTFETMSYSGGTEVSLMIVEYVPVPYIVDIQVQAAVISCAEYGLVLTVGGTRPPGSDTRIICAQSPGGGTMVPRGSFVNAMVNCPGTENMTMAIVLGALAGAVVGGLVGAYLGAKVAARSG